MNTFPWTAQWITPADDMQEVVPVFRKAFQIDKAIKQASLFITALGVYEAHLNDTRIGKFILAPGWTSYEHRLQYQEYDVTDLLHSSNQLTVTVGKGWYRGRIPGWVTNERALRGPVALLAELHLTYHDGSSEMIVSDESWEVLESQIRLAELYDGEICDASFTPDFSGKVMLYDGPFHTLIPQEGEEVHEQEHLAVAKVFTTPKGELVMDFGQNVTGYVQTSLTAAKGSRVKLSFAEVMDKEGNFYTENYRSAKAKYCYICKDGEQTYKPSLTFYGFRYIRIDEFPGGIEQAKPENFTAIAVYSDIRQTGCLSCSNPLLNQLFSNILWGQKGNFLDIPTDCPQRDERLGWTGDAQVFIRTACLNYDVEKFFLKWLGDLKAEQGENGYVGHVIPDCLHAEKSSAAWGDAAAICPWELYLAYGNPQILENQFASMCKWVDYITSDTTTPYLWTGGTHYGDWLGLDAPSGSYKGSSDEGLIASAFYAYSTSLVIKAGKALGRDVSSYETLYERIVAAFRQAYPEYKTQTECVLAVHFHLAADLQKTADQLAEMVKACGVKLQTGFVGTPYLLHVLSDFGYTDLAYSLLLREQYPSWLYAVTKGATTIWEHWDGIMENGDFWSADMNSYNHYAYGSVADWVYGTAAGIRPVEAFPGYEKVCIAPHPDARLDWLKAELETRHGKIVSLWKKEENVWRYEITTPTDTVIVIDGTEHSVTAGTYYFYSDIK